MALYTNQMGGWQTNAPCWYKFVTPWGVGRSESKIEMLTNNIVPIKSYTPSSLSNIHSIFTTRGSE